MQGVPDNLDAVLGRVVAALKAEGAREVYLFGSVARGNARADSDLDVAVTGVPPAAFYRAVGLALSAARMHVDVVDLDDDSPFTRLLRASGDLRRVA